MGSDAGDIRAPGSVEVMEGGLVVMECVAEAMPEANVTWLEDDQPLPTCMEDSMLQNLSVACVLPYNLSVLLIQEFNADSEGQYACLAENSAGSFHHEVTASLLQPAISEFSFLNQHCSLWFHGDRFAHVPDFSPTSVGAEWK